MKTFFTSILILFLCCSLKAAPAAVRGSGWTTTTNEATARTALEVLSAAETTNQFLSLADTNTYGIGLLGSATNNDLLIGANVTNEVARVATETTNTVTSATNTLSGNILGYVDGKDANTTNHVTLTVSQATNGAAFLAASNVFTATNVFTAKVGIGTETPDHKLTIQNDTAQSLLSLDARNISGSYARMSYRTDLFDWTVGAYNDAGRGGFDLGHNAAAGVFHSVLTLKTNNDAVFKSNIIVTNGGVLVTNVGSGFTAFLADELSDSTPFTIDADGNMAVGGNVAITGTITGGLQNATNNDLLIGANATNEVARVATETTNTVIFATNALAGNLLTSLTNHVNEATNTLSGNILGYVDGKDANTTNHVTLKVSQATNGAAFLAANQTFTGTNRFYDKVAIGTEAPYGTLNVYSTNAIAAFNIASPHAANALTVLTNGNVGIGTNNPSAKLHVVGDQMWSGMIGATPGVDYERLYAGYDATKAAYKITAQYGGTGTARPIYIGAGGQTNLWYGTDGSLYPGTGSNTWKLGYLAGQNATTVSYANFLGTYAGQYATTANNANFLGYAAGLYATTANDANFIGYAAGQNATNASYANFLGRLAGLYATTANYANFLGYLAGRYATAASHANFLGREAGQYATNATLANFIGAYSGTNVTTGGARSILLGFNTQQADPTANDRLNIGNTIYGDLATKRIGIGTNTPASSLHVVGDQMWSGMIGATPGVDYERLYAGYDATKAAYKITAQYGGTGVARPIYIGAGERTNLWFGTDGSLYPGNGSNNWKLGYLAGQYATAVNDANFIGAYAGQYATAANDANFIGAYAGRYATNASYANFLGRAAGQYATAANDANFLGRAAGQYATAANDANFLGRLAGQYATAANDANFLGRLAGRYATNASYANFLGADSGTNVTTGGARSILLGFNTQQADPTANDRLNIGNTIYGDLATKRIGIGTNTPASSLHVVGGITTTPTLGGVNYTGMSTNINVLIAGGTTNQLQFINGLLIGVLPIGP